MKGQLGFEFMFFFSISLIALIIILSVVYGNMREIKEASLGLEVNAFLENIGGKIDTVFLEGDGFSMNVSIPERLENYDYQVNIDNGTLILEMGDKFYTKVMLTSSITGSLSPGVNTISNVNGEVRIT